MSSAVTRTKPPRSEPKPISQLERMAGWMNADPTKILDVLNATAFHQGKDPALNQQELQAAIMVCNEFQLNPLLGHIHVIRNRGKLLTIVGIDGWLKIIHSKPDLMSLTHENEIDEEGRLIATTCRIVRRRRIDGDPVDQVFTATEYMAECFRDTEPWKKWPARMLRHKATIQCARYAYALTGIVDEDEAERTIEATAVQRSAPDPVAFDAPKAEPEPEPESPAGPTDFSSNTITDDEEPEQ